MHVFGARNWYRYYPALRTTYERLSRSFRNCDLPGSFVHLEITRQVSNSAIKSDDHTPWRCSSNRSDRAPSFGLHEAIFVSPTAPLGFFSGRRRAAVTRIFRARFVWRPISDRMGSDGLCRCIFPRGSLDRRVWIYGRSILE